MTLYRRKPQVVEAFKWMPSHETMDGRVPLPEWLPEYNILDRMLRIQCTERTFYVLPGEWILKQGTRIWTCSAETFDEMYEPMKE